MMMQVAIDAYTTAFDRMSKNTRSAYQKDLSQLCQYLQVQGVENWGEVTSEQITAYLTELCKTHGYCRSSVVRKFAAMKSFFRYLCRIGIIPLNPTEKVASPGIGLHQKKEVPQLLSQEQIDCLFEQIDKQTPGGLRDNAFLHLLLCTGMLASELLSLDLGDVHTADATVLLPSAGQPGQKNRRDRVLPLSTMAVDAIQCYLEQSRPLLVRGLHEQQALFLNRHDGQRLSRQGFWLLVRGYARKVGVAITPRVLRQTCVVRMLDAGMDVHTVQQLLGIAAVAHMRKYIAATTRLEQAEEGGIQQ